MNNLQNIINQIFQQNGREDVLLKIKINTILKEILGENISKNIKIKSIKNGKLYLKADNSLWAFEISINKELIINKLNEKIGKDTIRQIISK
jgi:predicted nucleic acid-binding Zn ribbon protein